jgi:putative Mg2+ transporter-C (MgtC) family protein
MKVILDLNDLLVEMGFALPAWIDGLGLCLKLVLAIVLGAILGYEREHRGMAAGLRTHMLVCLGAAIFTLACTMRPDSNATDLAQVIKGVAAGIGFLGAGSIIKGARNNEIKGLTTAASIWLAAAIGLAVGSGWIWMAIIGAILTWLILEFNVGGNDDASRDGSIIE